MGAGTITDLMYLKGNHMEEASPWLQSAHLEPGMEVIEKPKQAQGEQRLVALRVLSLLPGRKKALCQWERSSQA